MYYDRSRLNAEIEEMEARRAADQVNDRHAVNSFDGNA